MNRGRILAAVGLLALLLRLAFLWEIHSTPFFDLRLGDAQGYHEWATRIAGGNASSEVFYQAPLYPYLLALLYCVAGDSAVIVRILHAVLGAASCVLLAMAGMNLFGRRGAFAGALLAVYPAAIFLDTQLDKTVLATCLITALLALVTGKTNQRRWLAAGVVLGFLSLTRENAVLLFIPLLIWKQSRLALLAGCAAVLIPVAMRNLVVGGEFHLTTAQMGPNFYIGNHSGASGSYDPLVVGHGNVADERSDATRLAEQEAGRHLSAGEVSRFWLVRGFQFIGSEPFNWIRLMGKKALLVGNAAELTDTESQLMYSDFSWILTILRPFDFGIILALAAAGAVISWRSLWPYWALAATYAISVIAFYIVARYRVPLVPMLLLPAAAILTGGEHLKKAAVAALCALIIAHIPMESEAMSRATSYSNVADALSKDASKHSVAQSYYERALQSDPNSPLAHSGLGGLLMKLSKPEEAVPHYQTAIRLWPQYAEGRYNLGLALLQKGDASAAVQSLLEAVRLRPEDLEMRLALARGFLELHRPDLAAFQYQKACQLDSNGSAALSGWGVALAQQGKTDEAVTKFQEALKTDPESHSTLNNLGVTLAEHGRYAEAIPYLERALAIRPGDSKTASNLEAAREAVRSGR